MSKRELLFTWIRIIFKWARGKIMKIWTHIRENPTSWILATVALVSLAITYSNVELANRPFVGIENVSWHEVQNSDWFDSWFKIKNYGNKPALDYSVRNFRVIIMSLNRNLVTERIRDKNKELSEQYFKEYFLDSRNNICRETTSLLADYFYKYPEANKSEVSTFLSSWDKILPSDSILRYKGELLVRTIEVNNDMFDYFSEKSHLIYPNKDNIAEELRTQIGRGGISGIINGDNFIIIYWAIKYTGLTKKLFKPNTPKMYSTYYIGYNAKPGERELQEFRSWSKID